MIIVMVGLINAIYLTVEHIKNVLTGEQVMCVVHILGDCNDVLQSEYSEIAGIPVALLGVLYYAAVALLILLYKTYKHPLFFYVLLILTSIGFLVSLLLVYVQFFVIHAVCPYCMLSAVVSIALFGLDIGLKKNTKKNIE
ncbi:vitamin K epoxide reductase family protein [Patescibacteria group bacterium]|nr:vitamin K epoxide reductase family protein [Patescibacteria group bacterium]MBU1721692.1 vitamin K epoxide reductase family protein [Patescibacteria group bacterium]